MIKSNIQNLFKKFINKHSENEGRTFSPETRIWWKGYLKGASDFFKEIMEKIFGVGKK